MVYEITNTQSIADTPQSLLVAYSRQSALSNNRISDIGLITVYQKLVTSYRTNIFIDAFYKHTARTLLHIAILSS